MSNLRLAAVLCWILVCGSTVTAGDRPDVLTGTKPLEFDRPLWEEMVDGINRYAERELAASRDGRAERWKYDFTDPAAYEKSVAGNRARLRSIIGAVDPRTSNEPTSRWQFDVARSGQLRGGFDTSNNDQLAAGIPVRWPVLEGVNGAGRFLPGRSKGDRDAKQPAAKIIVIPDADQSPEMLVGFQPGVAAESQLARRLANNNIDVLVPALVNREATWSGHPDIRWTNQPHREFIYRMSFEMGRHIIGYEVQKVLAAVDLFERENQAANEDIPIAVVGIGEGGLIALFAAAIDPRIDAAWIGGYFNQRENVWKEPIYRNVWSQLTEFGDAELAGLIAPRRLIVEACAAPEVEGPPPADGNRRAFAAPGRIETPKLDSVQTEFQRVQAIYRKLNIGDYIQLAISGDDGSGPAGSPQAIRAFAEAVGIPSPQINETSSIATADPFSQNETELIDARQRRQFDELVRFTQRLMEHSDKARNNFWAKADRSDVKSWLFSTARYRTHIREEMIGMLPPPTTDLNPRTRKVIDEPTHVGYEVVLDCYPDVIAAGILLLPKDLKPDEVRPVVVCQHGLEGTPMDTITQDESSRAFRAYKGFSTQLVKRGFIVYAPQNPYKGQDRFRVIQRKSNPLKRSLFSYIIRQHEQTLEWLASLPNVDATRIAFYGLSYGGKTAVRVPPLSEPIAIVGPPSYCLSICSADFNEWVRKNVSSEDRYSYIFTGEYEMFEWNMGHTANYAELASLMTPRPFMVERGHNDGVAPDEWVAWEYAKVRRHYVQLGLGDKTAIEWFNGPHTINGRGTFDFLHHHLEWPKP